MKKRKSNPKDLVAYCNRSGLIQFGPAVPAGELLIVKGPAAPIRKVISVLARYSYPSKPGGDDEYPLVPGVPEAQNEMQAIGAVMRFIGQVKNRLEPASK